MAAFVALCVWSTLPAAVAAVGSKDTTVEVDVLPALAVAPSYATGNTTLSLPTVSLPGQDRQVSTRGWRLSSTWTGGYGVTLRSTTDPALKGANAVDGSGASGDSFQDFRTSGCPCPWVVSGFDRGVFGYSASVNSSVGTAGDAAQWGTSSARRWRGLSRSEYPVFDTGGIGTFDLELHFRSQVPTSATQSAGSYRANLIVGIRPLISTGNRQLAKQQEAASASS